MSVTNKYIASVLWVTASCLRNRSVYTYGMASYMIIHNISTEDPNF